MAKKVNNSTIITLGVVGILIYSIYKLLPTLNKKLAGTSGSGWGGQVGNAAYNPYEPSTSSNSLLDSIGAALSKLMNSIGQSKQSAGLAAASKGPSPSSQALAGGTGGFTSLAQIMANVQANESKLTTDWADPGPVKVSAENIGDFFDSFPMFGTTVPADAPQTSFDAGLFTGDVIPTEQMQDFTPPNVDIPSGQDDSGDTSAYAPDGSDTGGDANFGGDSGGDDGSDWYSQDSGY